MVYFNCLDKNEIGEKMVKSRIKNVTVQVLAIIVGVITLPFTGIALMFTERVMGALTILFLGFKYLCSA